MQYIVIETFTDLQDNNYRYNAGDNFPRKGLSVSTARLEELSSDKNRRHRPMINAVETDEIISLEPETLEIPVSKRGKKKKNAN